MAHRNPGHVELMCHDCTAFKTWSKADLKKVISSLAAAASRVAAGFVSAMQFWSRFLAQHWSCTCEATSGIAQASSCLGDASLDLVLNCMALERGTMSKAKFDELKMVTGFNHNPHGLLAGSQLQRHGWDPIRSVVYDWVHTMLSDGVWLLEANAVIKA